MDVRRLFLAFMIGYRNLVFPESARADLLNTIENIFKGDLTNFKSICF